MKKTLIPFLLFSLLINSCKKENELIKDGIYEFEGIIAGRNPVMYTRAGIITDRSIINSYIVRIQSQGWGTSQYDSIFGFDIPPSTMNFSMRLRIENKKGYFYRPMWGPDGYKEYELDLRSLPNNEMLGTYKDSATAYLATTCRNLFQKVNKYQGEYDTIRWTSSGSTIGPIVQFQQFLPIIAESNNVIVIPSFAYFVSPESCYPTHSLTLNQLNPNLVYDLSPGDTVLIRQRPIRLVRK